MSLHEHEHEHEHDKDDQLNKLFRISYEEAKGEELTEAFVHDTLEARIANTEFIKALTAGLNSRRRVKLTNVREGGHPGPGPLVPPTTTTPPPKH
jgi:hypothetical protein